MAGLVLVEQRYRAVLEVEAGFPLIEVGRGRAVLLAWPPRTAFPRRPIPALGRLLGEDRIRRRRLAGVRGVPAFNATPTATLEPTPPRSPTPPA